MSSGGNIGDLYKPLSSQQIETIHQKALDLLEDTSLCPVSRLKQFTKKH